jgi:hypothetical protein
LVAVYAKDTDRLVMIYVMTCAADAAEFPASAPKSKSAQPRAHLVGVAAAMFGMNTP